MSVGLAGERGSGVLGTTLGVGVTLLLLLTAAHVLTHLYATSVVTAATYDAAVLAAGAQGDVAGAERAARLAMGELGERAVLDWSGTSEDEVVVRVAVRRPGLVPVRYADLLGLRTIEREARVRVERVR